ncbi:hypothetical protein K523DRAFT_324597 [Schizophyllum commune Tattone D]|nr:hypothetical protein K523DRAFT_324597 [Schizophyllum commune Tattone D]
MDSTWRRPANFLPLSIATRGYTEKQGTLAARNGGNPSRRWEFSCSSIQAQTASPRRSA